MGFTKEDLRTGMICKHRNGQFSMIVKETFEGYDNVVFSLNSRTYLKEFDRENFKWDFEDYERVDIIEIYQPYSVCEGFIIFSASDSQIKEKMKSWKVLWSEDSVEEMTLEDICKALGKNIKIVR